MTPPRINFCFPLKGPTNGVKIISRSIYETFCENDWYSLRTIDLSQARKFSSYGKFSLWKLVNTFNIIIEFLKIRSNEIVYLNFTPKGFAYYRDILLLRICIMKRARTTIHIHANDLDLKINARNKRLFQSVNIIVINREQQTKLDQKGLQSFLVPNALPDLNPEGVRELKGGVMSSPVFLFLSNLSLEKGTPRLLELSKTFKELGLDLHLKIGGGILDSASAAILDEVCRENDYVDYLGPVSDLDIKKELFLTSDFLLLLSDPGYEVSPLVYIEALMHGLPILTTSQVVARPLIDAGCAFLLTEEGRIPALLDLTSMELAERLRLKYLCRAYYEKMFSFDKYVFQLKQIIESS